MQKQAEAIITAKKPQYAAHESGQWVPHGVSVKLISYVCIAAEKKSQWIFPLKTDKKVKHDESVQYFLTPWDRWIKQCGERADISQGLGYGKSEENTIIYI